MSATGRLIAFAACQIADIRDQADVNGKTDLPNARNGRAALLGLGPIIVAPPPTGRLAF